MFRLLALILSLGLVGCKSDPTPVAVDFAILDVNVIDMETGKVAPSQAVLIANGKITKVAPFAETTVDRSARTVFATGQYLMPGLTDSHVHVFADPIVAINKTLPLLVAHGITQVRDTGSEFKNVADVNARLANNPQTPRPWIVTTGPIIDSQKLSWYGDLQYIVSDAADASTAVDDLINSGAQQLKVYTNLKPEVYRAMGLSAQTKNMTMVGHLPRGVSLSDAANYGQRSIEHLDVGTLESCADKSRDWFAENIQAKFSGDYTRYFQFKTEFLKSIDWQRCRQGWQAYAEAGGYLTPTLVMETTDRQLIDPAVTNYLDARSNEWCQQMLAGYDRADADVKQQTYSDLNQTLAHIRAAGVPLLAGSDTPNNCLVPGPSLHWELIRLVDFGLSPLQALQAATIHPEQAFAWPDRSIKPSNDASLVLFTNNPLQDIEEVKRPVGVYHQGQWYNQDELTRLKRSALKFVAESAQ